MMRDFTYLNHHQTTESELRPDQTSPDHNPQQLGKLLFPIYFMAGGCRVSERSTKNHPHGVNRREANCMAIKGIIVNSIIACRILAQMGYTPPLATTPALHLCPVASSSSSSTRHSIPELAPTINISLKGI